MTALDEHLNTLPDDPALAAVEDVPVAEATPAEAPVAEAATQNAGETSQASEARHLLKNLLPKERYEKLPDSLKEADILTLLEDRDKAWAERHHAGQEKNQTSESLKELQAKVAAQEKILDFIKSQQQGGQQQNTETDPFTELGFNPERDFYEKPGEFFGKGVPQLTQKQIQAALAGPLKDIEEVKANLFWTGVREAQQKARPEDVKPEIWGNEKIEARLHGFMQSKKLDPRKPESWKDAWSDYKAEIALFQPKPASPTPTGNHANPPHATPTAKDQSEAGDEINRPANMSKAEFANLLDMAKSMGLSKKATKALVEGGPARSYGPASNTSNGAIYG